VAAPNGQNAYVVSLPTPAHAGIDESGPSLVPVNLRTKQLGPPIDFRATAIHIDAAASQAMFDLAGLAITPNGRTVLVADEADHSVIPFNVVTRQVGRAIVLPFERTGQSAVHVTPLVCGSADADSSIARDVAKRTILVDGWFAWEAESFLSNNIALDLVSTPSDRLRGNRDQDLSNNAAHRAVRSAQKALGTRDH